jgi:hypothetical protein
MAPPPQPESFDLIRWAISIAVPALAGLFGVWIGSLLASRRERREQRLSFLAKQLQEFYSALLGIRTEIRMRSEIRVKVHDAAGAVWPELCEDARARGGPEALQRLTETRWPEFERLIEYDNQQLFQELLPLYRRMVEVFRANYWLAEPDTRAFFPELMEYVELWNRSEKKSLPGEVVQRLDHREEKLNGFYAHLQQKHDELREKVRLADV